METTVLKVGNSLGFKVPEVILKEFDLKVGSKIKVDFRRNGDITLRKKPQIRAGWENAFALYALDGEDDLMLPDFLDAETDTFL